jgi:hypothetical protein
MSFPMTGSNRATSTSSASHPERRRTFQACSLMVEGWLLLLVIDFLLKFRSFDALRTVVRRCAVRKERQRAAISVQAISDAIDLACIWSFKTILCLQRSAATTLMLRRHGWSAVMLTGAQTLPFEFHAWCEINEVVVNDKPYMRDVYQVLDRW